MTLLIRHVDKGNVPRKLLKAHRAASKAGLREAVEFFHRELRDRRFTKAHARAAGYTFRQEKYTKEKQRRQGHTRPMEWTGETRDRVGLPGGYRFSGTSKSARVIYPGARRLNIRPKSGTIRMREEFERLLPEEIEQFTEVLDRRYQIDLNK